MSRNAKSLILLMACVMFGAFSATASTFYVEPGGVSPNFPSLSSAFTTIGAYAGTDHIIVVKAGAYSDANLAVPANIAEVYGEDKATVIFTAPLATDKFLITTGAQAGFKMHDMTIDGYERAVEAVGTTGQMFTDMLIKNGVYGIVLSASPSGNSVLGNCFVNNTQSAFDDGLPTTNSWSGNYFDDAPTVGAYLIAPGTNYDPLNQLLNNSVSAGSSQEVGSTFDVDINWTVPDCDVSKLAAYEFTVGFDAAKLELVSADFDEGYLGAPPAALYVKTPGVGTVNMTGANFSAPGEGSHRLAFFKFKALATGPTTITLASDYRDENGDPLVVSETPKTITVVDTQDPVLGPLVEIDPLGFDTYSDGSVAGAGPFYQLFMQLSATDNYGLLRLQYSWDGTSWNNWIPATGTSWTNAPGSQYINITGEAEGPADFWVRAEDLSGNTSNELQYLYTIDRTGPVLTSITLADDDGCAPNPEFTNASTVDVAYVASGVGPGAPMQQFYVDGGPWGSMLAYPQAQVSLGATPSQGSHIVYSRIYDAFNNMGNQTSDNIIFDDIAPTLTGPFSMPWPPPGAAKTNVLSVLGQFNAWDADRMQAKLVVSNGSVACPSVFTCAAGGWGPITYPVPVTLPAGDGIKTACYAIRDSAGNISTVISDEIEVDQTAPTITSVTVKDQSDGGTDCTNSWTVDVTLVFSATDAVWLTLDNGAGSTVLGDGTTILVSPLTVAYTFTGAPGPAPVLVTVNAKLTDNIGNVGGVASDGIIEDWQSPTLTGLDIADAAATAAPVYPALAEGPASVSNSKTVNLVLTGLPADATELLISEDGFATSTSHPISSPGDPFTFSYTYLGAGVECAYNSIDVKALDCAGNVSPVASDAVFFDFTVPTLTSIAGPAISNTPLIGLTLTASDCFLYIMRLSEDPAFTAVPWVAYTATPSFTLSAGDGAKTVYVQIADYTGNMASGSHIVTLDQTAPSGTALLRKAAPAGATLAGWTNTRTLNEIANIMPNGGAVSMWIANVEAGGTAATGEIALAGSYGPWALGTGADGMRTVNIYFKDGAGNWSPAIPLTIMLDRATPLAPASATGMPTGSLMLSWTAVPQAQFYPIRYNFSGDYPLYNVPNPPAPNDVQGFSAGSPASNSLHFVGPQPDMYHFSIWTMDSAGNMSAGYNTDVLEVNYILGDFLAAPGPDGCIDFVNEFFRLGDAYTLTEFDAGFEDSLDIAPTDDNSGTGYPVPDGIIDFEDLVIFALNYDEEHCVFGAPGTPDDRSSNVVSGPASIKNIDLIAGIPGTVKAGSEYTISITADGLADIKAYHLILDFDHKMFDLVKVEAGAIHSSLEEQWFFVDGKKSNIDITGVVLKGQFSGDEVARLTFKAKSDGAMNLTDEKLDLRDRTNTQVNATLSLSRSADALPAEFALSQNYPNPFNPTTNIELALPVASDYSLTIYNIAGQVVETFAGHADAGYLKVEWNAQRLASGIYLYKMVAGSYTDTKKMVLLK